MKAQIDTGDSKLYLFDQAGWGIATIDLLDCQWKRSGDAALIRLHLKRREEWRKASWGYEAKVRFI